MSKLTDFCHKFKQKHLDCGTLHMPYFVMCRGVVSTGVLSPNAPAFKDGQLDKLSLVIWQC